MIPNIPNRLPSGPRVGPEQPTFSTAWHFSAFSADLQNLYSSVTGFEVITEADSDPRLQLKTKQPNLIQSVRWCLLELRFRWRPFPSLHHLVQWQLEPELDRAASRRIISRSMRSCDVCTCVCFRPGSHRRQTPGRKSEFPHSESALDRQASLCHHRLMGER